MPPLSLSLDIQYGEITEKLEAVLEDLSDIDGILTGLTNEKEEYETWISKDKYNLDQLEPNSFVYGQIQRRINKWNLQVMATEEIIDELRIKEHELKQQEQILRIDLSLLSEN